MKVSYKKQIVFGLIMLIILLSVVEGISQILWHNQKTECDLPDNYYAGYEEDFLLKLCDDYKKFQYVDTQIRTNMPNQIGYSYSINEHGFRGENFPIQKEDNEYRIFMIGGSTTFGLGATSNEQTISAHLESILKNSFGDRIRVINAGVIAAKSSTEVFNIKYNLLKFSPDMIIIFDGYNDAFNIRLDEVEISEKFSGNIEKNNLESFVKENFKYIATPNVIYQYTNDYFVSKSLTDELKIKNTENWLKRWNNICKLSHEEDFELFVTIQPMLGTGDRKLTIIEEKLSHKIQHEKTFEFLNDLGNHIDSINCPHADLRNTFDGYDEQVYFSLVHTGDNQNKILAERIYAEILPIISQDIKEKPNL